MGFWHPWYWAQPVAAAPALPITPGYTYVQWGALKSLLAARLQDPSKVFFVDAELGYYLEEALHTFSLISSFWRYQSTITLTAGEPFYDLPDELPFTYLAGSSITDQRLINTIEYHMQEAVTTNWSAGWTGTGMFTLNDVSRALQRRRDQFLVDTGVVITRTVAASGAPATGRIYLPDDVIDVRRLAWVAAGVTTPLWRVDEYQLTAFSTDWSTGAVQVPRYYSILSPPPLTVQLAPAPTQAADVDMLTVNSGASFSPTAFATPVGVSDDMAWIIKWGALADLLSKDGPAMDPDRADYCQHRYEEGLEFAKLSSLLISAKINGTPLITSSVYEMDSYNLNWQDATSATPTQLLSAGRNLVAFYPPPLGTDTVTVDIARNAPIPAGDATFVEIGRELVEAILDYAEHLAMFKVAGEEWKATQIGYQNLVKSAALYNARLKASAVFSTVVKGTPSREDIMRGRVND